MATSNLAFRYREENVRAYEKDIAEILTHFPSVVVFHPRNVETFSCRLRDAIRSYREHQWKTSLFSLVVLNQSPIIVGIRGSQVIAGSAKEVRAWEMVHPEPSTPAPAAHVIVDPDHKALTALMELHHQRILTTPTIIHVIAGIPLDTHKWEELYDVVIEPLPSGQYKIL